MVFYVALSTMEPAIDSLCVHPSMTSCKTINSAYEAGTTYYSGLSNIILIKLMDGIHTAETSTTTFARSVNLQEQYDTHPVQMFGAFTGSVFVVSTSGITVTFETVTLAMDASSALTYPIFSVTAGTLSLVGVNVTSSTTSPATTSATVISLTSSGRVSLSDGCIFSLLNFASGNGSAINGILTTNTKLSVLDVTFQSCSARFGGAIYLSLSDNQSSTDQLFLSVSITFRLNSAESEYKGNTLYVAASNIGSTAASYLQKECVPTFVEDFTGMDQAYGLITPSVYDVLYYLFYPPAILYVSSSGSDSTTCATESTPCLTVSRAYQVALGNTTRPYEIYLISSGTHSAETSSVLFNQGLTYNLNSSSATSTVTKTVDSFVESVPIFHISFNSVESGVRFERIVFRLSDTPFSSSLFDVDGGSFQLADVVISASSSTQLQNPLVDLTGTINARIRVTVNTPMSLISTTSTNGSAIHAYGLTSGSVFDIESSTFTSCTSPNGYGGAIYIDTASLNKVSFFQVTFTNCSDMNPLSDSFAQNGIHIECPAFTDLSGYTHWGQLFAYASWSTDQSQVPVYHGCVDTRVFSLLHLLFDPVTDGGQSYLTIGSPGYDFPTCGWADLPCFTLQYAVNNLVVSSATLNLIPYSVQEESQEAAVASKSVTITPLHSSDILTYTIGGSSPSISYTPFTVTTGTLAMSLFDIFLASSFTTTSSVFSLTGSGTLSFTSMSVSSSDSYSFSSSLISIGSGTLSLSNTSFISITRSTAGNGAIVQFTSLTRSLSYSNLTFTSCRCTNGNGGAISVTMASTSAGFSLTSSTTTGCTALKGGALYLSISAKPASLSFLGLSISGNSATASASSGDTLFIVTTNCAYVFSFMNNFTPFVEDADAVTDAYISVNSGTALTLSDFFLDTTCVVDDVYLYVTTSTDYIYSSCGSAASYSYSSGKAPCSNISNAFSQNTKDSYFIVLLQGTHLTRKHREFNLILVQLSPCLFPSQLQSSPSPLAHSSSSILTSHTLQQHALLSFPSLILGRFLCPTSLLQAQVAHSPPEHPY